MTSIACSAVCNTAPHLQDRLRVRITEFNAASGHQPPVTAPSCRLLPTLLRQPDMLACAVYRFERKLGIESSRRNRPDPQAARKRSRLAGLEHIVHQLRNDLLTLACWRASKCLSVPVYLHRSAPMPAGALDLDRRHCNERQTWIARGRFAATSPTCNHLPILTHSSIAEGLPRNYAGCFLGEWLKRSTVLNARRYNLCDRRGNLFPSFVSTVHVRLGVGEEKPLCSFRPASACTDTITHL